MLQSSQDASFEDTSCCTGYGHARNTKSRRPLYWFLALAVEKKAHGYAKTENVDVVAHKYIFHDHNLVISPTRAEKIARLRRKDRTLDTT